MFRNPQTITFLGKLSLLIASNLVGFSRRILRWLRVLLWVKRCLSEITVYISMPQNNMITFNTLIFLWKYDFVSEITGEKLTYCKQCQKLGCCRKKWKLKINLSKKKTKPFQSEFQSDGKANRVIRLTIITNQQNFFILARTDFLQSNPKRLLLRSISLYARRKIVMSVVPKEVWLGRIFGHLSWDLGNKYYYFLYDIFLNQVQRVYNLLNWGYVTNEQFDSLKKRDIYDSRLCEIPECFYRTCYT